MSFATKNIPKSPYFYVFAAIAVFATALSSCKLPGWDTDLESFVDYGRSIAYLDSSSYVQGSAAVNTDVRSGTPVTVTVQLNNPKALALAYTLSADSSLVDGSVDAPASTTGAADGITTVSFSFTPTAAAEHGDIEFKLGLSAPTINRSFDPVTFKVRCDSTPSPVTNLTAGIRTDGRACIGFTLPEDYANADIAKAEITYTSSTAGTTRTITEDVSPTGSGLTTVPSPAPLSSSAGKYVRYYLPDDVIAGNQYTFTVTPIDASGKKCESPTSASLKGTELYLGYDANGGTGTVAAKYGYNLTTSTTIASASSLTRDGYGFTGWNTKADGTGTSYTPDASYTFGTSSLMLYAQWQKLSSVTVTITTPGYQGVAITQNGTTATAITMDKDGTLTLMLPTGASSYQWYVNGADPTTLYASAADTASTFSFYPTDYGITAGQKTITGTMKDGSGVYYSVNVVVTVTKDAMVTIIPYGATATYDLKARNSGATTFAELYDKISPYSIAKTETTYEIWSTVFNWAIAHGYAFGSAGSGPGNNPVSTIRFADMIVWCNAYSELEGLQPCYTYGGSVLRSSNDPESVGKNAVYDRTKNGYRLPTEGEWQYAASGRGATAYDQVSGHDGTNPDSLFAVYSPEGAAICATKRPNILGLYDMSGNLQELCVDRHASADTIYPATSSTEPTVDYCRSDTSAGTIYVALMGGSYGCALDSVAIGDRQYCGIQDNNVSWTFRLARTITK